MESLQSTFFRVELLNHSSWNEKICNSYQNVFQLFNSEEALLVYLYDVASFSKNANVKKPIYPREITFVRNKIHTISNKYCFYFFIIFRHVSIQRQMIKGYLTTWINTIVILHYLFFRHLHSTFHDQMRMLCFSPSKL